MSGLETESAPVGQMEVQAHRAHPAHNGARVYVSVPASSEFNRHHNGPDLCECNECIRLLSRVTVQKYPSA